MKTYTTKRADLTQDQGRQTIIGTVEVIDGGEIRIRETYNLERSLWGPADAFGRFNMDLTGATLRFTAEVFGSRFGAVDSSQRIEAQKTTQNDVCRITEIEHLQTK